MLLRFLAFLPKRNSPKIDIQIHRLSFRLRTQEIIIVGRYLGSGHVDVHDFGIHVHVYIHSDMLGLVMGWQAMRIMMVILIIHLEKMMWSVLVCVLRVSEEVIRVSRGWCKLKLIINRAISILIYSLFRRLLSETNEIVEVYCRLVRGCAWA